MNKSVTREGKERLLVDEKALNAEFNQKGTGLVT